MSRGLKPTVAERFWDGKTRTTVELMLNRNENTFFAVVEHERLEADAIHDLKAKVKKALEKQAPVQWARVIELSVSQGHGWGGHRSGHIEEQATELSVRFRRFETGKTSAGLHVMRPFLEDEHETWRDDVIANPMHHSSTDFEKGGEDAKRIPYTDGVWAALTSVKETIEAAYAKLEPLFDTKDNGQKLLALTGIKLLPASTVVVDASAPKKLTDDMAPGESAAEYVERKRSESAAVVDGAVTRRSKARR